MVSMKYDLPMLDYKTRFSLWQVKMRAILAQTNDLDEALEKLRSKRSCGPPNRLIEECNLTYYALSCVEQVENASEPATYSEAIDSFDKEKWISAM